MLQNSLYLLLASARVLAADIRYSVQCYVVSNYDTVSWTSPRILSHYWTINCCHHPILHYSDEIDVVAIGSANRGFTRKITFHAYIDATDLEISCSFLYSLYNVQAESRCFAKLLNIQ